MNQIYGRNKKIEANQAQTTEQGEDTEEKSVKVDGFGQIVEMLKIADPEFRESLLKRLSQRDAQLASQLRRDSQGS